MEKKENKNTGIYFSLFFFLSIFSPRFRCTVYSPQRFGRAFSVLPQTSILECSCAFWIPDEYR